MSFAPVYTYSTRTPANKQEGTLLIVSDDPSARRALHTRLHNLGFDIAESATGEEAMAFFATKPCCSTSIYPDKTESTYAANSAAFGRALP
jgi:CheY-like chemotaxis protein